MDFVKLNSEDQEGIQEMSAMATEIVREHFDPLIGKAQNDYMISLFQTVPAITDQLKHGYQYYFVNDGSKRIGFLAFYPKKDTMYLSKFYLYRSERGHGYSKKMLQFVIDCTRAAGLKAIELNVNKHNDACRAYEHLGFTIARSEKNDIGNGFFMDDYVYRLDLQDK